MHEDERENEQDVGMCLFQYLLLSQCELRSRMG